MSISCRNCDATIEDHAECPWCLYNREQLLDRLNGQSDKAAGFNVVASWALHGWEEQPERVWWVR